MEWVVDAVLGLAGLLVIVAGWRRGALRTTGSVVGVVGGLWLGFVLAPLVVDLLAGIGWVADPVARTIASGVVVLVCASVVYGIVTTLMLLVRRILAHGPVRVLDRIGGSVIALIAWAVVVWLVAGFLQATMLLPLSQAASSSRIVQALDAVAPVPATRALGTLDDVLATAGFPEVFAGAEESIHPVAAPDPAIPEAVRDAGVGVVKVLAAEPRCGTVSEGSGWVVAKDRVVTNAHVVAGSDRIQVQTRDARGHLSATLVVYDPERDLAVLAVPRLGLAPLELGGELGSGDAAVVAGYPDNGGYTATAARVRRMLIATGTDIYHDDHVERSIYSLRTRVYPGNSGGPLFDPDGQVAGVVFARSTTDGETGYALTLDEVMPVLKEAGASAPVDSGRCVPD